MNEIMPLPSFLPFGRAVKVRYSAENLRGRQIDRVLYNKCVQFEIRGAQKGKEGGSSDETWYF